MFKGPDSLFRVPFDGTFDIAKARTTPPSDAPKKEERKEGLRKFVEELSEL